MGFKQAKSNQKILGEKMPEQWWKDYDKVIGRICPDYEDGLNALVRGIPANARSILEIGAGTGNLTARIAQAFPQARILGIDSDESMLARASPKLRQYPNVELVNRAAQDASYDDTYTVASSLVFHLMTRKARKRTLENIYNSHVRSMVVFDRVRGETMTEEEMFLTYFALQLVGKGLPDELRAQLTAESRSRSPPRLSGIRKEFEDHGFKFDVLRKAWRHGFVVYRGIKIA